MDLGRTPSRRSDVGARGEEPGYNHPISTKEYSHVSPMIR